MNILLTSRCNRRCPYCFAAARISYPQSGAATDPAPEYIREADFGVAIDFLVRGRQRVVGLLGGEPSLHPAFPELAARAWSAGLDTKIFTNGLWPEGTIDAFLRAAEAQKQRPRLVLNLNQRAITPDPQHAAQEAFLERIGKYCALSFNIYEPDFDPLFLVDVVRRFRTRRDIRLGIAEPLAESGNAHIDVADYPKLAGTLMRLAAACDEHGIRLGFDCGFTLCMFTPEQIGRLVLAGARFRSSCGPVIDVGTDLSVWACFPLSTLSAGVRLTDFDDLRALVRHFQKHFGPLYRTGVLEECIDCRHRLRGRCTGGCAAHVFRRFQP